VDLASGRPQGPPSPLPKKGEEKNDDIFEGLTTELKVSQGAGTSSLEDQEKRYMVFLD
jgi:hypothetical protein